jgi:hypothetical protein
MTPRPPARGSDLERWRIENGLTPNQAAEAFGIQILTWNKMAVKRPGDPIDDPVIERLLAVYEKHPASAPVERPIDVREFYRFLGFADTPKDRQEFAKLLGRSEASAHRLLVWGGKMGRPLKKWVEAVRRLGLSPEESRKLMRSIAEETEGRTEPQEPPTAPE